MSSTVELGVINAVSLVLQMVNLFLKFESLHAYGVTCFPVHSSARGMAQVRFFSSTLISADSPFLTSLATSITVPSFAIRLAIPWLSVIGVSLTVVMW